MAGIKKNKHPLVKEESVEKESKPKKEAKSGKSKSAGVSIAAWGSLPALTALLIIFVASAAIEFVYMNGVQSTQQSAVTQKMLNVVKRDISFLAESRLNSVQKIASSDVLKAELLSESKSGVALLQAALPDLNQVFVVPQNKLQMVRTFYPELGYASVDLIRKAEEKPSFEAFFDGKKWYYQIAIASKGDEPAHLLFVFDMRSFEALLKAHSTALASNIAVFSGDQSNASEVMRYGSPVAGDSVSVNAGVAQWRLVIAPTQEGVLVIDRMLLWAMLAAAALISAIAIYAICKARVKKVTDDVVLTASLVLSSLNGHRKASDRLTFSETIELVQLVNKHHKEKEGHTQIETKKAVAESLAAVTPEAMLLQEAPAMAEDDLDFDDLDLDEELGLSDDLVVDASPHGQTKVGSQVAQASDVQIDQSIFRAYDIRGIVNESLTPANVEIIGKAFASQALSQGQSTICVGYDGRLSSEEYCEAICRGITSAGADAIVIGRVPTPVLYFATHHLQTGTGVMITGSHNPSNYNGFKMMIGGVTLSGDTIQHLYTRIVSGDFEEGFGTKSEQSVDQAYVDTILNDVAVAAPLKVVLDAGNGVAGELAPYLVEELGCEVIPLYCDIDGTFPNHHPDPGKPANLKDLIAAVQEHNADVGLAFDGDGDRVGVVTNSGKIIWPDRLLMLFAKDVVSRNPGADIIYDVKCSRRLNGLISSYGGRPIMWKTGHSLIKAKMKETGALLAGEMSGHIFFKERWFGFDDGLYSAVRLLEILGMEGRSADEVFDEFPEDVSTPEINVAVSEENKFLIVEKLCALKASFVDANVSTIDGLRADYADGWGLCRASNTTPVLVLRFEADDEFALERIKAQFKKQLIAIDSSLNLDF